MVGVTVDVLGVCPLCGKEWHIPVPANEYTAWKEGALIQDAMPSVSAEQREMLISGICPECWNKYLKLEEDEHE